MQAPLLIMKASGEENAINDIAWCPDNSTIFASVTADAKLQIWDINASSIDPLVTVDTVLDDVLINQKVDSYHNERGGGGGERGSLHDHGGGVNHLGNGDGHLDNRNDNINSMTPPPTPGMSSVGVSVGGGGGVRRQTNGAVPRGNVPGGNGQGQGPHSTAAPNAPVAQLLRNLSQSVPKRSLTCLQFGEK